MGPSTVPIADVTASTASVPGGAGAVESSGRRAFLWFLVLCVAGLIFFGGQVKSHNAGLAEPDWPLGYGQVVPTMVGGVFWEHGHRLFATTIGLLTIVAAVWTARHESRPWVRRLGWTVLGLVVFQGVLGGLGVLALLPPLLSAAHGTLAQVILCLTGWWALALGRDWTAPAPRAAGATPDAPRLAAAQGAAVLAVVAVFVQLLLGAVMRHNEAGLAVPFFPVDAQGHWLPEYVDELVILHMAHRAWAVVAAAAVWRACVRAGSVRADLLGHGTWLAFAVLLQVLLGASVVWMDKHPLVTSVHVVNGALVLMGCALLALRLWRARHPLADPGLSAGPLPAPAP